MDEVKNILVLSKSTKHCQKAIRYGVSLAKTYDAKLFVMHIIHDPFKLKGWNLPLPMLDELEKEFKKMVLDAKADLDRMIEKEKSMGMEIVEVVLEGEPEKELFQFIEKENIDILVMLAYEQWRLENLFFNREIHDIIRKMPCSVFLVKKEVGK